MNLVLYAEKKLILMITTKSYKADRFNKDAQSAVTMIEEIKNKRKEQKMNQSRKRKCV